MSIIGQYLAGWDALEPVILGTVANGFNPLFLGKHGCGKSSLVRFIANALNESGKGSLRFRKYSMDKENIVSMIGMPDVEAMKQKKLSYVTHERSIFNADVILLDEITRAPKETQNLVLEVLEEKTCFGHPLPYKYVIATANDETYQAAFKLDAALLDRFYVVVPAPSTDNENSPYGPDEVRHLIELNMGKRKDNQAKSDKQLADTVAKIREAYEAFWHDKAILTNVVDFASKFMSMVLASVREMNRGSKTKFYISQRDIGLQFCRVILAIASYYKVVKEDPDYLLKGAHDAYKYAIATKNGIPLEKLDPHFEQLKGLLTDKADKMARLKIALTTGRIDGRLMVLNDSITTVAKELEADEIINIFGNILQELDRGTEGTTAECKDSYKNLLELDRILSQGRILNPALDRCYMNTVLRVAECVLSDDSINKELKVW